MKRRAFLSTIPSLLVLPTQRAEASGPGVTSTSVLVTTVSPVHPRVRRSVAHLVNQLRELKYSVEVKEGFVAGNSSARLVIVGVPSEQNRHELERMGRESQDFLSPDSFELKANAGAVFVMAGDDRGLVYALSQLRRSIALERGFPASLNMKRQPVFPVRRWSTSVSHDFGSPWDERIYIAQRFAYIKSEVFPRACEYGMNSIEINGRPGDGWDVDWVIGFEKYQKLSALLPPGERQQRLALVEDLASAAHDNLLEILVWSHELHLPAGFLELYPQVQGVNFPVCLSNEFLHQFVRDKYREFFAGAPSIDGLVMSVAEAGQFSLITDQGCQCDRCKLMTPHDRIRAVLDDVIAVASELKKQIVLRTFLTSWIPDLDSHPELETMRKAYTGLPEDVVVMSKYCPIDFYGGEIADNPLIGAFPNRAVVEFSLDVEWQGRTFVPVLTAENFRRRVAYAVKKNCAGIVARVDFPFPTMEPEPIFGHPNDFNAWYMGELLWNPESAIDGSLLNWSRLRYGQEAAPLVSAALRKTEAITQETFFALGQTVINYHNMLASVAFADNSLYFTALSKWDPSKRNLSRSFFRPDEDLVARARQEKQDAIAKAQEALSQIHQARGKLSEAEYQRLRYDFENLEDTAQLWDQLLEFYLRHRQLVSSPVKTELLEAALSARENDSRRRMLNAASAALQKAAAMELKNGRDSWPVVSPDRGVSVYEFVNQILRHYMAFITEEPVHDRVAYRDLQLLFTVPVYEPNSTETFWRKLVEFGRPGFEIGAVTDAKLVWPKNLRSLRMSGLDFTLSNLEGRSITVPLVYPVREMVLSGDSNVVVSITKYPDALSIEKTKTG